MKKSKPSFGGSQNARSKSVSSAMRTPPGRTAAHIRLNISTGSVTCCSSARAYTMSNDSGSVQVITSDMPELDLREAALLGEVTRKRELDLVHVQADHRAGLPDDRCDVEGHLPATASDVQAPHARSDARPVKECERARPVNLRKHE